VSDAAKVENVPEGRYDFQGLKNLVFFAENHEHINVELFSDNSFDFGTFYQLFLQEVKGREQSEDKKPEFKVFFLQSIVKYILKNAS
jgi:hypothetical protein